MNPNDAPPDAEAVLSAPKIWQERFDIRSYEVDGRNRLSLISIFNFLQHAASNHAAALGVSTRRLLRGHHTWLLSRLKIKIEWLPGWRDSIKVRTWPSGSRRLFALRDFQMQDHRNRVFAKAVSAWLVMDLQRRRPVRVEPFVEKFALLAGGHCLPDGLEKLPAPASCPAEKTFAVRYRDLDLNQHVNNAGFVEWLVESVPLKVLQRSLPVELEINFLAEAFYEDRILAACRPLGAADTCFDHILARQQDGRELLRARSMWRPA